MKRLQRRQILHLISINAATLSGDPFRNYVVQHVLSLENPEVIETISFALTDHRIYLSLIKWGSFVLQRCFKFQNIAQYIVKDFLSCYNILLLSNDRYGNYVI